ncbi:MAG: transaldolase [Eubacterium sp.]|nr:transaldolase [Eubacterium sp.]
MVQNDLHIKIYADGADAEGMKEMYAGGYVSGFTTNPTLMKKAGVTDYAAFAASIAAEIQDLPLSFEVFSDDFESMEKEARIISSWGKNVYVKIPVTNTKGDSSLDLVRKLSADGMKLNVTALLTLKQVDEVVKALTAGVGAYVSVFAGRIADTGVDPCNIMRETAAICRTVSGVESLWASTRELFNIFQAQDCGIDIITVTNDILKKLPLVGMDLKQLSLETVQMFRKDAVSLGYRIV